MPNKKLYNYIMKETDIDLKHSLLDEYIRYEGVIANLKEHRKAIEENLKAIPNGERMTQKIALEFTKNIINHILGRNGFND